MTSSESNETLGLGKNRIEALTDGIFATVMTILVLSLTIPVITQPSGNEPPTQQLIDELGQLSGLLPAVLTYIISFVILGVYWVGHHNLFHHPEPSGCSFHSQKRQTLDSEKNCLRGFVKSKATLTQCRRILTGTTTSAV